MTGEHHDWEALRAKFPPELITKVDKGFGPVDTLNHAVVTDRLQKTDPFWKMEITRWTEANLTPEQYKEGNKTKLRWHPDPNGLPHVLAVYGWMEVFGVRRYEVGEVENISSYGDEAKKAISDFIKRAAMRFGVGLDLWTKEDLDGTTAAGDEGAAQNRHKDVGPSTGSEEVGDRQGTAAIGEGATGSEDTSTSFAHFIGGKEANALQKALGGPEKTLTLARETYGEQIEQLTDLTFAQARDLVASKGKVSA